MRLHCISLIFFSFSSDGGQSSPAFEYHPIAITTIPYVSPAPIPFLHSKNRTKGTKRGKAHPPKKEARDDRVGEKNIRNKKVKK